MGWFPDWCRPGSLFGLVPDRALVFVKYCICAVCVQVKLGHVLAHGDGTFLRCLGHVTAVLGAVSPGTRETWKLS